MFDQVEGLRGTAFISFRAFPIYFPIHPCGIKAPTLFCLGFPGKWSSDFLEAIEAIEMIARPKHKHHQDENDRGNREYWRREKALDEALKNTFPASDPVSVEQPGSPTPDAVNSTKS